MRGRSERDEAEFDAFCRSVSSRLVGSLVIQTGDRGRAQDIAQEALARAWVRWSSVATMASPEGWVFRVAFNLAIGARRRGRAEARANARIGSAGAVPSSDDVDDRLTISAALRAMPPRQRAVVALRFYAGLSVDEAAAVMGCAPGTVKSTTSHAVQHLREVLDVDVATNAAGNEAP
jgi:RNA polymerase sigma-70 factor (sigma-E family)